MPEACHIFLACGELLAAQHKPAQAASVVENLFRLGVQDKDLLQASFTLLQKTGLIQRGIEYLESLGLDKEPEFKAMMIEALLLDKGNLELAKENCFLRKPSQESPPLSAGIETTERMGS